MKGDIYERRVLFFAVMAVMACFIAELEFADNAEIKIGERYDVLGSTVLRSGPGEKFEKKINKKATEMLGKKEYLSIDESTTIRVLKVEKGWAEIQVEEPDWLRESHTGWIPIKEIRLGASAKKLEGWIRYNCLVYKGKSEKKPIGTLAAPASVGVADDGSGWLKIIHAPIRTLSKERYLTNEEIGDEAYIKASNFTTEMPGKWNK